MNSISMKIYRFRKLTSEIDHCRLREILETGKFWCSSFWELNDPMEGVFSYYGENDEIIKSGIDAIYSLKNKYKICSFSGVKGFENPIMWGYYAGGFKGVAVEVEVREDEVKKVRYKKNIADIFSGDNYDTVSIVKEIFTRKLEMWEHENEYRFLEDSENNNYHKIGEITAVYFGNQYGNLSNTVDIQKNKKLAEYNEFKKRMANIARGKNIHCYNVRSKNTVEIVKDNEL